MFVKTDKAVLYPIDTSGQVLTDNPVDITSNLLKVVLEHSVDTVIPAVYVQLTVDEELRQLFYQGCVIDLEFTIITDKEYTDRAFTITVDQYVIDQRTITTRELTPDLSGLNASSQQSVFGRTGLQGLTQLEAIFIDNNCLLSLFTPVSFITDQQCNLQVVLNAISDQLSGTSSLTYEDSLLNPITFYDGIAIPRAEFINVLRMLNRKYGLYSDLLVLISPLAFSDAWFLFPAGYDRVIQENLYENAALNPFYVHIGEVTNFNVQQLEQDDSAFHFACVTPLKGHIIHLFEKVWPILKRIAHDIIKVGIEYHDQQNAPDYFKVNPNTPLKGSDMQGWIEQIIRNVYDPKVTESILNYTRQALTDTGLITTPHIVTGSPAYRIQQILLSLLEKFTLPVQPVSKGARRILDGLLVPGTNFVIEAESVKFDYINRAWLYAVRHIFERNVDKTFYYNYSLEFDLAIPAMFIG